MDPAPKLILSDDITCPSSHTVYLSLISTRCESSARDRSAAAGPSGGGCASRCITFFPKVIGVFFNRNSSSHFRAYSGRCRAAAGPAKLNAAMSRKLLHHAFEFDRNSSYYLRDSSGRCSAAAGPGGRGRRDDPRAAASFSSTIRFEFELSFSCFLRSVQCRCWTQRPWTPWWKSTAWPPRAPQ